MAGAWKYRPIDDVGLPALFADVLARHVDVHLIAVGPEADADWAPAIEATAGRIHAVGEHTDPARFLDAGDIAVDSHPISSETAVRDVALTGMPVVSLARWRAAAPACTIDLPGRADAFILRGTTDQEFLDVFDALIADPDRRRDLGTQLRDAVAAEGLGAGFVEQADELYDRVLTAAPMTASQLGPARRAFDATDAITVLTTGGPEEIPTVEQLLHSGEPEPGRRHPRYMSTRPTFLRARAVVARIRDRLERIGR